MQSMRPRVRPSSWLPPRSAAIGACCAASW
ncbi:CRISPR-associated protein Cas5 [Vogesella facilis]|uniref:CRISPR-associated protein Cas5 n=1 Tax=Vogesella facilis TaxID=1655232 RepID=A0ABV7RK77_9NEIS